MNPARSGLTPNAESIAKWICEHAQTAAPGRDSFPTIPLRTLGLSDGQVDTAVEELERLGYVDLERAFAGQPDVHVFPKLKLFRQFDPQVKGWDPSEDAKDVAEELLAMGSAGAKPAELEKKLGWDPRRLNPAAGCAEADFKVALRKPSGGPYAFAHATATAKTKHLFGEAT
jgi:hypothetical protein